MFLSFKRVRRQAHNTRNTKNENIYSSACIVEVEIVDVSNIRQKIVRVRVKKEHQTPSKLVVIGNNINRVFCADTGLKYFLSNGWYQTNGKSIKIGFLREELKRIGDRCPCINEAWTWDY